MTSVPGSPPRRQPVVGIITAPMQINQNKWSVTALESL
jgi:hypothetical protein